MVSRGVAMTCAWLQLAWQARLRVFDAWFGFAKQGANGHELVALLLEGIENTRHSID